ncbi:MAG: phosphodiesterase [Candidatus Ornithospirochaeta sp.]
MKLLIASDIHGDYLRAQEIYDIWKDGSFDSIILLGDLLYHGPRNDLPLHYNPKKVIPILSEMKDTIVAVRGNCDAEVDQMVLPFPILEDKREIEADGKKILLVHGHHEINPEGFDVVMSGHTHIPVLEKKGDTLYLNPGSTTIPKGGSAPSYAIWDNGKISIISLDDGNVVKEWE